MMDDILAKVTLHRERAKHAMEEIVEWSVLDATLFEDFEKIKTVDCFIYRFIKLQDLMGEKLFRYFLDEIGEYRDDMSLIDILDKLERFNIVENPTDWMRYRKLRNKLTHEYPNNEEDVIEGIQIAMDAFEMTETILNNIGRL